RIKVDIDRRAEKAPYLNGLPWLDTGEFPIETAGSWQDPRVNSSDLAFLQYTSGSTAEPKGVMLTHRNLLHNSAMIWNLSAYRYDGTELAVFWLPLYHDMGLIGGVLQVIYSGGETVLMPPVAFLANPLR